MPQSNDHPIVVIGHRLCDLDITGATLEQAQTRAEALRAKGMVAIIKLEEQGASVYKRPFRPFKKRVKA